MRKTFSGVIGVLLLAMTGLPMIAMAQGHGDVKDVNVVNTPSVTVANTPSVNVANTPAVTVSNSPTVTVGNTPSVNVANTPAVTISNTTGQPVLGSSIDQPGRIAYQSQVSIRNGSCSGNGTCFFEFGSVPAGHRVVIQHVSGVISFSTTASAIWVQLNNGSASPVSTFFTPMAPSLTFSAFDQPVLAYFDPAQFGGIIEVQVGILNGTFPGGGPVEVITLSGYELDCNAAPCAAIAH